MKKFLLGTTMLASLVAAPAMAADMPVKASPPPAVIAMYNWTGFYIGTHTGYAWGDSDWTFINDPAPRTFTSHSPRGFFGGAQTGFNMQWNRLVLGIEGSVSITGIDERSACPNVAFSCRTDIDHFWRAGGRLGFAFGATGNWLVYGSGGYIRARVFSETPLVAGGAPFAPDTQHHSGLYFGGGLDWGVTPNFVIGVEAFRASLDTTRQALVGGAVVAGLTRDIDLEFTAVLVRGTYKFNWGRAVVARN